jgi:hypothetical protein
MILNPRDCETRPWVSKCNGHFFIFYWLDTDGTSFFVSICSLDLSFFNIFIHVLVSKGLIQYLRGICKYYRKWFRRDEEKWRDPSNILNLPVRSPNKKQQLENQKQMPTECKA